MTPDPQKCLSESRRVLKDGGVLACSSWQTSDWMDMMNLVPKVRPDKVMPEIPKEWSDIDLIRKELEKAGFSDVESHQVAVTMKFNKLQELVDLCMKLPHMVNLVKDMSGDETSQLKALMFELGKKSEPREPGELHGTALVAVGRR